MEDFIPGWNSSRDEFNSVRTRMRVCMTSPGWTHPGMNSSRDELIPGWTHPGMNSSRDNFQLGPNDRVETCPGMKMRTIPHVNNPPFRPGIWMATVDFLKICGSLEKMYMNPHLENSKKISATRHGHAEAHTCTCTRQVRSSRTCCCLSCCCEETTDILARASSLYFFLSVKAQIKAPYALKIRIQTWFDCKTSLKTGTNLATLK